MPLNFRNSVPRRNPDITTKPKYQSYRDELKIDFQSKCWYCDDSSDLGIRYFAIDHFVPKKPKWWVHPIPDNEYTNLVYSCSFCNGAKSNKWPTKRHDVHHDAWVWFIDPAQHEYDRMFTRDKDGAIRSTWYWPSDYVHKELKLWLPIHSINWKIHKINLLVDELANKIPNISNAEIKSDAEKLLNNLKTTGFDLFRALFSSSNDQ